MLSPPPGDFTFHRADYHGQPTLGGMVTLTIRRGSTKAERIGPVVMRNIHGNPVRAGQYCVFHPHVAGHR